MLGPDDKLHVFYTGYNLRRYGGKQTILHARATDRQGTSFAEPAAPVVIQGDRHMYEDVDFRDAFVFYNDTERCFWMLVATRLSSGPRYARGCIALLTSPDLNTWTVSPEPLHAPNDVFCPECPELFRLPNGRWYLVYSRFHAPDAGTVYRVADGPRGPFRVPRDGSRGRLDGRRWYAAKSCSRAGDPSRRVVFGWVGDYVDDEGKWLWGGDLGLPREVSADEDGHLRVDIGRELRDLLHRSSESMCPSPSVYLCSVGSTTTHFPKLISSPTALNRDSDLFVSFRVSAFDAPSFGVQLQTDVHGKGHRLRFTPSPSTGNSKLFSVSLWTDFPPLDDFWADQYALFLPRPVDGPELVRHDGVSLSEGVFMVLRGRLVEVFCGGRSLTFRLPRPDGQTRKFGWFVEDGVVDIVDVSIRRGIKGVGCRFDVEGDRHE